MLLSVLDSVVFDYDSPTIASRCCHTVGGWFFIMVCGHVATLYVISKDDDFSRR